MLYEYVRSIKSITGSAGGWTQTFESYLRRSRIWASRCVSATIQSFLFQQHCLTMNASAFSSSEDSRMNTEVCRKVVV